ncbi:MAG: adenylate/guanylate cyclase domain-containing protein [Alphaproteobacteria bacterium]
MPEETHDTECVDVPALPDAAIARAAPIVDWLIHGERIMPGRMVPLLERYAKNLVEAGLPLARMSLHIRQLHPQLAARSLVWDAESGNASELGHDHGVQHQESYLVSPVKIIFEGGPAIRRRLADPDCPLDFPILKDFKDAGLVDYVMLPIKVSGDDVHGISIATRAPGGFQDLDIATLESSLPTFGAILELQHLRRTARDLLSTYVGPNTGELIFSGAVRPGDGEIIHAIVWFCDLRGFTALSEGMPLPEVISILNKCFDRMAQPVVANGGEILKFIGDAVLAIFPCDAGADEVCTAADAAIAAAEAAVVGVAALNQEMGDTGGPLFRCGVAIHVGEVMYGNVGAADRLDFTVIGPAVNLVTRMEPLCAQLDQTIVVSSNLANASQRKFRSLGEHAFKGIAKKEEVFTPS